MLKKNCGVQFHHHNRPPVTRTFIFSIHYTRPRQLHTQQGATHQQTMISPGTPEYGRRHKLRISTKFRTSKIKFIAVEISPIGSMGVQNVWGHAVLQMLSVKSILLPSFLGIVSCFISIYVALKFYRQNEIYVTELFS
jgi:hypothetical protein